MQFRAAVIAAAFSGVPSTVWALVTGDDPLEASRAAGSLLLPRTDRPTRLLVAGGVVHVLVSLGWTQVLTGVLRRAEPRGIPEPAGSSSRASSVGARHTTPAGQATSAGRAAAIGAVFGLTVAAVDLGLAHLADSPRLRRVAALPVGPQVADHVAFGVLAALTANHP